MILNLGLDIGSTTVKIVGLDENDEIIFKDYTRHKSDVIQTCKDVLNKFYNIYPDIDIRIMVTGSGAMVLSKTFSVEFVQEVVAQSYAIKRYLKDTDVSIELGGEDSKITYLSGQVEQRMNSICAAELDLLLIKWLLLWILMLLDLMSLQRIIQKFFLLLLDVEFLLRLMFRLY